MPTNVTLDELLNYVRMTRNFEVIDYQGDRIVIDEVRGIVKLKDEEAKKELGELRRRSPRGRATERQVKTVEEVVRRLVENKVKFKVVFGAKEVTIRFDLEHYIRLSDKDVRIVGFSKKDEGVLGLISGILESYGPLVFLRPIR